MPKDHSTPLFPLIDTPSQPALDQIPTTGSAGSTFGRWSVIDGPMVRGTKWPCVHLLCRCECGTERWIPEKNLRNKKSRGCVSCRSRVRIRPDELVGQTIRNWKILAIVGVSKGEQAYLADCRCVKCSWKRVIKTTFFNTGREPHCPKCNVFVRKGRVLSHFWQKVLWAASVRGLAVTVSSEHVFQLIEDQEYRCALTGCPIGFASTIKEHLSGGTTASLDRIESNLGYEQGNIRWVHKTVNCMKMDLTDSEFHGWCQLVLDHHGKSMPLSGQEA